MGIFMTLFSLGERLALCASMVRPGTALADVGTDHAYLPVWLAKQGLIAAAVASDVRSGPLERAKRNIEKYGVGHIVNARLSDGLDAILPEEADDVVIAGMGGLMIAEIVRRAAWLKNGGKRLILQPMTREEDLRRSLAEEGFFIVREQAAQEEHRVYTAMLCAYGTDGRPQNELFPYIGLLTSETPASRAYLRRERKRLLKRANGLKAQGDEGRALELFRIRERIGAMLPPEEPESEE